MFDRRDLLGSPRSLGHYFEMDSGILAIPFHLYWIFCCHGMSDQYTFPRTSSKYIGCHRPKSNGSTDHGPKLPF